jgi:hypothetical protein
MPSQPLHTKPSTGFFAVRLSRKKTIVVSAALLTICCQGLKDRCAITPPTPSSLSPMNVLTVTSRTGASDAAKPAIEIAGILEAKVFGDGADAGMWIGKGCRHLFDNPAFMPRNQVLTESSQKQAF